MFEGNISLSIFGQFSTCPKQLQMVLIKIEQNLSLLFVILEILNAKDRPTVGAHLCLLKIFWTFAQRWFYIFHLSICIFLFYISYIFVSFHHWSELIFASWSSFWSSSQLLHSTDGIALSTQWHVSILIIYAFSIEIYAFLILLWCVAYFFKKSYVFMAKIWNLKMCGWKNDKHKICRRCDL